MYPSQGMYWWHIPLECGHRRGGIVSACRTHGITVSWAAQQYHVFRVGVHVIHMKYAKFILSYYNKRNAHFDIQEILLQFWTERRETWQEYGEA